MFRLHTKHYTEGVRKWKGEGAYSYYLRGSPRNHYCGLNKPIYTKILSNDFTHPLVTLFPPPPPPPIPRIQIISKK